MHRIVEIRRLDHVVLLVPAQAMLGPKAALILMSPHAASASSEWRQVP